MQNKQTFIRHQELFSIFRDFVKNQPTQDEAAKTLGISPQYLGDMLRGRSPLSADVAQRLGWEKCTVFFPVSEQPAQEA